MHHQEQQVSLNLAKSYFFFVPHKLAAFKYDYLVMTN